jgi:hypothetical protein
MTGLPDLNIDLSTEPEPATLRVALVNSSQLAFFVRSDIIFGGPLETPEDSNLLVVITDSEGRSLPYQCLVERNPIREPEMRVLRPGDVLTAQYLLSPCYAFETAKQYLIKAEYLPGPYVRKDFPEGSRPILHPLVSNVLNYIPTKVP